MFEDDSIYNDDPIAVYLSEIHKVPPMTRDEEAECFRHLRAGDQQQESAAKRLMEANLLLVVSIAENHPRHSVYMLDILQAGNVGLIGAIQTYDGSSREEFLNHARACIESAIANMPLNKT